MNRDAIVLAANHYWDIIEASEPEIWPGSTPWRDRWGSLGSIPDATGYGTPVARTRVPAEDMERFWAEIIRHSARHTRTDFYIIHRFETGHGFEPVPDHN